MCSRITLGAALESRQESAAALRAQPACSECPPAKVDLVTIEPMTQ